jgi:hypothetical protein
MLIQVDVDSTLYNADSLFSQVAKEHFDVDLSCKNTFWGAYDECASRDTLIRIFRKAHSKEYVEKQIPYEGASEALKYVEDRGHKIVYVSDRHPQARSALANWLIMNEFPLTRTNTGFDRDEWLIVGMDKRQWMRDNRPSIVIDDRVRTLVMARFELEATSIGLRHPWNENLLNEVEGIYICQDWNEIGRHLERLA